MLALELPNKVVDHAIVKVFSPQVGVTCSGLHFKNAILNGQDRDIKGTAAKIKNEHTALAPHFLVQAVCNSSSSGFIDDAEDLQSCNCACILGGLTLRVVEVCRNSDHGSSHRLPQIGFRSLLHLGQHHGRNFLGVKGLVFALVRDLDLGTTSFVNHIERPVLPVTVHRRVIKPTPNETLGVEDGVAGVHGHLVLGCISYQPLRFGEGDVARCSPVALVVGNDLHLAVLEHANARVGSTQVNANRRCCHVVC